MKDLNSLLKIQLIELVIAKRNDCFRLEEENKKLKDENLKLIDRIIADENFEDKLIEENKNLKEELDRLKRYLNTYKRFIS